MGEFPKTERELLLIINEQLISLRRDFNDERSSSKERESSHQTRMEKIERELDSLRMSRAQLIAGSGVMGAVMAALMKVFWPSH